MSESDVKVQHRRVYYCYSNVLCLFVYNEAYARNSRLILSKAESRLSAWLKSGNHVSVNSFQLEYKRLLYVSIYDKGY